MLDLSSKIQEIASSPIRKLVPYAEKAKKNGIKVHHLNIGQPDLPAPTSVQNFFQNYQFNFIEYSHSAGMIELRKIWAKYYQNLKIDLNEENILICNGGSEALIFAFLTCLNPGDELIIPEPFYANYNSFAKIAGIKIVPIPCWIENNFELPNLKELEKMYTPKTKGVLICNPNNPTGYLYSQEELNTLTAFVKKYNLFLFADEVYREFRYDGTIPDSLLKNKDLQERLIVIDSVSKRFSMCGARVGALISKNQKLIDEALKLAQARLSPPTLGQLTSIAAFSGENEDYFETMRAAYRERRDSLVQGLNQIPGVICPNPQGAFYVIAQLPVESAEHFAQWLLEFFHYKGETVMLAPAEGFYNTKGLGKNQVRIAYVIDKAEIEKSIKILELALEEYIPLFCPQKEAVLEEK